MRYAHRKTIVISLRFTILDVRKHFNLLKYFFYERRNSAELGFLSPDIFDIMPIYGARWDTMKVYHIRKSGEFRTMTNRVTYGRQKLPPRKIPLQIQMLGGEFDQNMYHNMYSRIH